MRISDSMLSAAAALMLLFFVLIVLSGALPGLFPTVSAQSALPRDAVLWTVPEDFVVTPMSGPDGQQRCWTRATTAMWPCFR